MGRCVCLFSSFRPKGDPNDAEAKALFERMHDELHQVVEGEDFTNAASTWRGMRSAPEGQSVVFGRNERILREYHRALADHVGLPLAPPSLIARG